MKKNGTVTVRGGFLLAFLAAAIACDGARDAPAPNGNAPLPPGDPGDGPGGNQGGAAAQGGGGQGQGANGGSGNAGGGSGTVTFADCGCALVTFDDDNALCGDCVQIAQDEPNDPCFIKFDACLTDPGCVGALGDFETQCDATPTIECAEGALAGMPTSSALLLVDYFACICVSCSPDCDPPAQGAGGGQGEGGDFGGPPLGGGGFGGSGGFGVGGGAAGSNGAGGGQADGRTCSIAP